MLPIMKPIRRFWQFHLSTAIMLMFVAGVLVGLCFEPRRYYGLSHEHPELPNVYGWPFPFLWGNGEIWLREESRFVLWSLRLPLLGMIANVAIDVGILLAAAIVWERFIRRRSALEP